MLIFWWGRRGVIVMAAALAVLVGAGLWLGWRSVAAPGTGNAIAIDGFAFRPASITVARGTKVVWTNDDGDVHTVTSADDPKLFTSPALDSGDGFAYAFNRAGTFRYICSVHPYMHGTIIVK
ncbi:MAG TPA: cupredoxin family copper-binding protein [Stellaceae bacterium]|nr:cupredoxin family copper-binding protein [Stellaceae bacterium]